MELLTLGTLQLISIYSMWITKQVLILTFSLLCKTLHMLQEMLQLCGRRLADIPASCCVIWCNFALLCECMFISRSFELPLPIAHSHCCFTYALQGVRLRSHNTYCTFASLCISKHITPQCQVFRTSKAVELSDLPVRFTPMLV